MKTIAITIGTLSLALVACNATTGGTDTAAQAVVLDVRCELDSDCPSGFECEDELEHGVATTFCVSHDESVASAGECPAGFELEEEHGGTFCKPHGGDDDAADEGAGGDDSGEDDGAGAGGSTAGIQCSSDADCPAGEECEIELEHGVSMAQCKPHGGEG